jgi:signal peptidase II
VILVWARSIDSTMHLIPLGMVLGGGLGNLFDRVVRDTGGRVVDFIDLHVWPVFNVADSAIVLGVIGLLIVTARTPDPTTTDR